QVYKKEMPKLKWTHGDADGKPTLAIGANRSPKSARLWIAHAPTRDFRKAKWEERPATRLGKLVPSRDPDKWGHVFNEIAPPADGFLAFFAELEYELNGLPYHLSTQMRIAAGKRE